MRNNNEDICFVGIVFATTSKNEKLAKIEPKKFNTLCNIEPGVSDFISLTTKTNMQTEDMKVAINSLSGLILLNALAINKIITLPYKKLLK
jgi:hypothetical protein